MSIPEALRIYPKLILVRGDSDKYLTCTKRFLNILKDYSPYLEIFSIDEAFLELPNLTAGPAESPALHFALNAALNIKQRIRKEVGSWITCSVGISYNKVMAKMAGSMFKPDGLVVIEDEQAAQMVLDQLELDEICGIGGRIKRRLNNMGVFDFKILRQVPLSNLLATFKSYGQHLYNLSRGIDETPIIPFYLKEEIKSVGHRHTFGHDTSSSLEIKQTFLKLTELIARKLRSKKLVGKTVTVWIRNRDFSGDGVQTTITLTDDGLEVFQTAWSLFLSLWSGQEIRMIWVSISNLSPTTPQNLSLLDLNHKKEVITRALDNINNRYGEFTLQRGILLNSTYIRRKPNPYLADYRFKI